MNVEIFSCSGGLALGFQRAGIRFDDVIERNPDACNSYRANIGHAPRCVDAIHYRPRGHISLFVADPPCTPWSRAGKRKGLADGRDMLQWTVNFIARHKPDMYLIANVPGLDDSTNWPIVQRTIGGLSRNGYCVSDFRRLNAAHYGVPQFRIRPFWFGHLWGPCIRWPEPTHGDPSHPALPGLELKPWVTCRAALGHLSLDEMGRPVRQKRSKKHPMSELDKPAHVVTANGSRHQANVLQQWPWDRPATTVMSDSRIPPPGHHGNNSYMSDGIALSVKAALILQGFPETWILAGDTKTAKWNQIGQAMPPPLAEAVARSILERAE